MTPDLMEERLRSALHDATSAQDGAYLDLDPSLVLGRGRRAVLRRRMAAGASVAAATVLVGLVGWSALGGGAERASVPGGSPSTVATGTVTAELQSSAVLGPEKGTLVPTDKVEVTVDRAQGVVRYATVVDGQMTTIASGFLPTTPRASTWTSSPLKRGLTVGLVPDALTQMAVVWSGDSPGSTADLSALPGTGFQAFAVWDSGTSSESTLAGFDWTDGTGVYRPDGSQVTSGRSGEIVAFVDGDLGQVGMFDPDGSGTKRLADTEPGGRPVVMLGRVPEGGTTMANTVLVVLPAGADDVVVTPRPGATLESTDPLRGGTTDEVLVVVRLSVPQSVSGTGVQRVSWTGADGVATATTIGF